MDRNCLRQWKQQPVSHLIRSANVSCWSMVTPMQILHEDRQLNRWYVNKLILGMSHAQWRAEIYSLYVLSTFSRGLLRTSTGWRHQCTKPDMRTSLDSCQQLYVKYSWLLWAYSIWVRQSNIQLSCHCNSSTTGRTLPPPEDDQNFSWSLPPPERPPDLLPQTEDWLKDALTSAQTSKKVKVSKTWIYIAHTVLKTSCAGHTSKG